MFLPESNTPRWIVLTGDVITCLLAFLLAYLVRFEFSPPREEWSMAFQFLPFFIAIRFMSFFIGKTYVGIIRFTGAQDGIRIFMTISAGSAVFVLLNVIRFFTYDHLYFIPFSVVVLEYLLTMFIMLVGRFTIKILYQEFSSSSAEKKKIIVFGAGESGLITKRAIDRDSKLLMKVVAFVDDDPSKVGKSLEGSPILPVRDWLAFAKAEEVEEVIIAIQDIPPTRKADFLKQALDAGIHVSNVPPVKEWVGGELSFRQLREVAIEDLLGREVIHLDSQSIGRFIQGKQVLVTGGAGSIGSELVRQLRAYQPKRVIILDQAETPLFEFEQELTALPNLAPFEIVIGDVCQYDRMRRMMSHFKPDVVFHAAAYKHVPLMELNPSEAIHTNVEGTKNMADLSIEFGASTFIFISTDKAVNPTNVMGATKRVAEMYVQSLDHQRQTRFITTRFGNVLGSNGSVIPVFRRQIQQGGPVTVTHPDVTRFFMTIPEAVDLVLEAAAMAEKNEIFAFDMGESVKVIDLAKNMIRLSGLELGRDIEIQFTGLRPGEKLFEEVLSDQENTIPTHHPKILRAQVRATDEHLLANMMELIQLFETQDNRRMVAQLKKMVPEFVSNNSVFEQLDK
ncbi:MAG: polysaccharide biosynthesis protein, partial [Flavobacteriales bacterium]